MPSLQMQSSDLFSNQEGSIYVHDKAILNTENTEEDEAEFRVGRVKTKGK